MPSFRSGFESNAASTIRIGALVPLTRPGWVDAGRHLLAGLQLAVSAVNKAGGAAGKPLELLIRDTAADPQKATLAVDELASLEVTALTGEYHSVVARAAATRAAEIGLPFLCSSAVLDRLTEWPTKWVARLAPPQSKGWQIYANFLVGAGHRRIAVATQQSLYWTSGTRVLEDNLHPRGGNVTAIDMTSLDLPSLCDRVVDCRATALLLLVGNPEPAISIVKAVRRDNRLAAVMIGAPAGQPEFREWPTSLGENSTGIPFLRYLPEHLSSLGSLAAEGLRQKLAEAPSFVAFEGYDAIVVLADAFRSHGIERDKISESWPTLAVQGTRGTIRFSLTPTTTVWQWDGAPIQVAERTSGAPHQIRILHLN